jgi:hypothetical protein
MIECIYKCGASFYTQCKQRSASETGNETIQDIRENTRTNRYRLMNKHRQTTLRHHRGWTKHRQILQHYRQVAILLQLLGITVIHSSPYYYIEHPNLPIFNRIPSGRTSSVRRSASCSTWRWSSTSRCGSTVR